MTGSGRRASRSASGVSQSPAQEGSARRSRRSRGGDPDSPSSAQENVQPNAPVQPSPAKSTGTVTQASQPASHAPASQDVPASLDLHLGTESQDPPAAPQNSQPAHSQPASGEAFPPSQNGASQPNTAGTGQTPAHRGAGSFAGSFGIAGQTPLTGARLRSNRPELGMHNRPTLASSLFPSEMSDGPPLQDLGNDFGNGTTIWGTNITTSSVQQRFHKFVKEFRPREDGGDVDMDAEGEGQRPKYIQLLAQTILDQEYVINLDGHDLHSFDKTLYDELVKFPQEVLPLMDDSLFSIAIAMGLHEEEGGPASLDDGEPTMPDIKTRPFNLIRVQTIRDLDPNDINKLVAVSGMITRTSAIIPDLRSGAFLCEACGHSEMVAHAGGLIKEPSKCTQCSKAWTFKLIHNRSDFVDKQLVKMQESPNHIPEGETPHNVTMYSTQDNVDLVRPGDRVTITGIYRATATRVNPRQRVLSHMFRTYIDIIHVQRDEKGRLVSLADQLHHTMKKATQPAGDSQAEPSMGASMGASMGGNSSHWESETAPLEPESLDPIFNVSTMTHEQLKAKMDKIKALSKREDLYDVLTRSLAPNVWGMEDVKKGILCMLFGGTQKVFPGGRIRGELNLLLVGDPGVSKSQLLGYVHQIAPRGIYTSGRGSSAVGLTAYVSKDPETGEMVLESGALVLSDRGVCCIDEFDKMSDSARSMLHEVMEQQTVSIAKAGLISTLNARTSVLASANPIDSRYDRRKSLVQNINLPPTLLSRFDLIYRVLDECQKDHDRRLARHLVSLYHENPPQQQYQNILSKEELKEYIAYARLKCTPKITDAAQAAIVSKYIDLRRSGREQDIVAVTPRQLESLIRLSEAQARMKLQPEVGVEDVEEAFRLWYGAMTSCATTDSGEIDMDAVYTGFSKADREAAKNLDAQLSEIFASAPGRTWGMEAVMAELNDRFSVRPQRQQVVAAVRRMEGGVTFNQAANTISTRA